MLTDLQKRKRREYVAIRRLDPLYKAKEAERNKEWRLSKEVKKQKVINQTRYQRLKKFGLSEDDLMELRLIQGGHCLICDSGEPGGRGDWHIDHDHQTGKIRGLLCSACNRGLGMFKDNPQFLRNAALYIEQHKEQKMAIWTNADGLTIRWGRDEGSSGTTGQYGDPFEGNHILEARIDLTKYPAGTNVILDDFIHFPKGFRIERVGVYTEVAASGGTSFDAGFIANDRVTEIDYDGLVAALPIANINAQGKRTLLEVGSTGAGALVGTVTTPSAVGAYPTVKTTGTFTAGVILLRVTFHRPLTPQ